ncbi:amidase [Fusarium globosum]|uniref:Amidase n=1 Tax=Fusarium globosum TaxID=78864 RepID=A0A8H6DNJ2_9HYPO|nr:amidase [Fusarium globosum]
MLTSNLKQAMASTFPWTSGSLSSPAQNSAVISIKPTVGLTSQHGAYLVSEWQDTIGVLARTVQDVATVLIAIAGTNPNDPFTISDPRDDLNTRKPGESTNFAHTCTKRGLEGKKIAACSLRIPRHLFPNDEVLVTAFDMALPIMRAQGATIVDNVRFSELNSNYTFSEDLDWTLGLKVSIRENWRATAYL